MKNLFKKQSAKFVQNLSSFTEVMAKTFWCVFYAPQCSMSCVTNFLSLSGLRTDTSGRRRLHANTGDGLKNLALQIRTLLKSSNT